MRNPRSGYHSPLEDGNVTITCEVKDGKRIAKIGFFPLSAAMGPHRCQTARMICNQFGVLGRLSSTDKHGMVVFVFDADIAFQLPALLVAKGLVPGGVLYFQSPGNFLIEAEFRQYLRQHPLPPAVRCHMSRSA